MNLQITGTFDSSTTKSNGQQNMRLKFPYSEIANYSKLLMLVAGGKMKAIIVNEDGEKIKLGTVYIDSIRIDKDGEAKVAIVGETSNIEMSNICNIIEKIVTLKVKTAEGEESDE